MSRQNIEEIEIIDNDNEDVETFLQRNRNCRNNCERAVRVLRPTRNDLNYYENIIQTNRDDNEIVIQNEQINQKSIMSLIGRNLSGWIDDEIMNAYLKLLKNDRMFYFNVHFMNVLIGPSKTDFMYDNVKKWFKGPEIFTMEKVFFPFNHGGVHWVFIVAYPLLKTIILYDSLSMLENNVFYLRTILRYFETKYESHYGTGTFTKNEWRLLTPNTMKRMNADQIPVQTNGYDCGVFVLSTIHFLSKGIDIHRESLFNVSTPNMSLFRISVLGRLALGRPL